MTKKDFTKEADLHTYGGRTESAIKALFFDWKAGQNEDGSHFRGFKYCVFARAKNATKKQLIDALYNAIHKDEDTPWFIQCIIAQNDSQRFKVPVCSSGLTKLIKYETCTK